MTRLFCFPAIALMLALNPGLASAKIYKWTDSEGNVHYSQKKPPSNTATEMNVKTAPPSGTKPRSDPAEAMKNTDDDDTGKSEKEKLAQQEAKLRKDKCKRAQSQFQTINTTGRLYEINAKGDRTYWDDATRTAKLAEAQKAIEDWCQ